MWGFPGGRDMGLGAERGAGAVWGFHLTYHMGIPPCGQTDPTENIFFPQTTYASGNETCVSA